MKQKPGKLGIREYAAIAILMVGSKATEDTPAFLYTGSQNAAWMVPILSAVVFFVPLFLLIKTISLFQGKNLFSVIQQLLGKYIGFLVCLVIFIISSLGISYDSRTYIDIIKAFYFNSTPHLVLYAILMAICTYGAKKGIQHIGSVSYLIVFYTLLSGYFIFIISFQDSNFQAILPIWGSGIPRIFKESIHRLPLFADFFLLTMLIPYLKSSKEFRKGTWIAYSYVTIHISTAILMFIVLFDRSSGAIGYPFHTLIRYISLGNYIPNVEIIFFVIWIMGAFIRFTAFLYVNALMFGYMFKIKDFEYLIPSLAAIYLMIGIIPESSMDVSHDLKPMVQSAAGPAFAAISLMVWIAALLKGEFKHAKNKSGL
ncbi:GerAB/ArcD/ProY family transporter [Neobacillus mesonae]|uniref:GerAB/ArcD/ProY family transporter n=1 Tax=Neobacillus mesonae TaxID=1193713 RepID=UPI00203CC1C0|nr:GerAB/ArcD/ProY family transporter [Neobacillus mesonae]MCM3570970.1 spore germination protein [Neobacillus mesonae]